MGATVCHILSEALSLPHSLSRRVRNNSVIFSHFFFIEKALGDKTATMADIAASLGSLAYLDLGNDRVCINIMQAKRKLLIAATTGVLEYYVYSPVHEV